MHEIIQTVYDHWRGLRHDDCGVPCFVDFDISKMPRQVMNQMVLLSIDEASGRIQYRIVGATLSKFIGRDFSGMYADQADLGPERGTLIEQALEAISKRDFLYISGEVYPANMAPYRYEGGYFPLCDSEGKITRMIFTAVPTPLAVSA